MCGVKSGNSHFKPLFVLAVSSLFVALVNFGRLARKAIRPTAFARTLVDSPDDIQHSTTWRTDLSRCYFSYLWISRVQSLSFHAFPFFRQIDLVWANCYRAKRPSGETTFTALVVVLHSREMWGNIQRIWCINIVVYFSSVFQKSEVQANGTYY